MGFSICYRSTRRVSPAEADAIERAADVLCRGRTWLGCEPVGFHRARADGHLSGGSKPNFMPDPDDAASAAREGLPNGTTRDLLDILRQLSREHGIDWEISHDESGGPAGYVRSGVAADKVVALAEAFADLGDDILEDRAADGDDDDAEPPILPFRPKGE